ncbi:hypothetical protein [Burkholderia pseudomallei]|uniref:hypothetical protein n=1 Tax=Burkholderia pseudomallei TaxID=28450 RepID=UPI0014303758|nr:hypothetical protein [Burkholderia pseudomallei]
MSITVRLKFPADDFSKGQRDAYPDIAGDDRKLAAIGPDDGRCGDADRQSQPSSSAQKQPGLEVMVGDKLPSSGGIMPLMPPAYRYRFPDSNDGSDAS